MNEIEKVRDHVKRWQAHKRDVAGGQFNDLARFAALMNLQTRGLISALDEKDPDFWESLSELANNAATLTDRDAKLIVNGKDRTKL